MAVYKAVLGIDTPATLLGNTQGMFCDVLPGFLTAAGFEWDGTAFKALERVNLSGATSLRKLQVAASFGNDDALTRAQGKTMDKIMAWPPGGTIPFPPGSTVIVPVSGGGQPATITDISGAASPIVLGAAVTTLPQLGFVAQFESFIGHTISAPGGAVEYNFMSHIDENFAGVFANGDAGQGFGGISLGVVYEVTFASPGTSWKLDFFQKDPNTGAIDASVSTGFVFGGSVRTAFGISAFTRGFSGVYLPELPWIYGWRIETAGAPGSIDIRFGSIWDVRAKKGS